jgi:hypothetical protein
MQEHNEHLVKYFAADIMACPQILTAFLLQRVIFLEKLNFTIIIRLPVIRQNKMIIINESLQNAHNPPNRIKRQSS